MSVGSEDVRQMVILAVVVGVAVVVVGQVFAAAAGADDSRQSFQSAVEIDGDTATLTGSNVSVGGVEQSLGDAAALDGSRDSYVAGAAAPNVSGDFYAGTYVRVDNTTGTRTVYADDQRLILYNGSSGQWVGVYYEASTGRTWSTSLIASDPTNWTHVALQLDAGALELIEDNQFSSVTATNDGNVTTQAFTGDNLEGDLDETRVFDEPLTDSERQQLVDSPTAPLDTAERDYRVMYDSYSSSPGSFPAFFVSSSVDASGVTLVDGFAGQPTQAGTDYRVNGDTITALDGGSLDGAPVVYAAWTASVGLFNSIFVIGGLVGTAFRLGGLLVVVVVASLIYQTELFK